MSRQPQIDEFVHELSVGRIDRRTFLQRVTAAGYSLGVAGSLAAAVGAGRARAAEDAAGTLRIRSAGDVGNLDPAFVPGLTETVVMTCVYEGLVGFKPGSYKVVPVLADKFELSKDGKRIDFTLRKGIQFHGGYGELTAADVKFSYERTAGLTSPPINSPYQTDWAALAEVHVRGKYSGRIILKNAFAPLMTNTLPGFDGYIVSKKAVEDLGANMAHHPIGTAPCEGADLEPDPLHPDPARKRGRDRDRERRGRLGPGGDRRHRPPAVARPASRAEAHDAQLQLDRDEPG